MVPTWNYAVAHAHGTARAVQDPAWMLAMLHQLTRSQESHRASPWSVDDAPAGYIEKLMRGMSVSKFRLTGWRANARPARTKIGKTDRARCRACYRSPAEHPTPWRRWFRRLWRVKQKASAIDSIATQAMNTWASALFRSDFLTFWCKSGQNCRHRQSGLCPPFPIHQKPGQW